MRTILDWFYRVIRLCRRDLVSPAQSQLWYLLGGDLLAVSFGIPLENTYTESGQMKLMEEIEHAIIHHREGAFYIPMDELTSFKKAWILEGGSFWIGSNIYGAETTIKLFGVFGITVQTTEVLALLKEEREERERRDLTT